MVHRAGAVSMPTRTVELDWVTFSTLEACYDPGLGISVDTRFRIMHSIVPVHLIDEFLLKIDQRVPIIENWFRGSLE